MNDLSFLSKLDMCIKSHRQTDSRRLGNHGNKEADGPFAEINGYAKGLPLLLPTGNFGSA